MREIETARKRRKEAPQRVEWLDTALKLKQRGRVLEKEIDRMIFSTTGDMQPDVAALKEEHDQSNASRTADTAALFASLSKIRASTLKLRNLIQNPRPGSSRMSRE